LLLLNIGQSVAQLSISATNTEISNVLRQIEEKSDYTFFYSDNFLNLNQKVTIQAKDETIDNILNRLFRNTNIGYRINNKQIALSEKIVQNRNRENIAQQQARTVTGKVIDENGDPVIGTNIIEKGTTNGTVTDVDGNFSLRIEENAVLHISYIGYLPQDINTSDRTTFTIVLVEDTKALEELVVIGYGTARKIDLTGSTSSLGGDQLRMKSTPQLSSQMQGQMAGVQITRSSGDPSAGATIRVRGVTTMSTNDPLVIVDGIPGTLTDIAPEDVKDIQVLKDAASAAIYGSRAAAGVILVTTKRARNNEFHLSYNGEYGIMDAWP